MRLASAAALSLFYLTSFAVLGAYLPYFNLYLERIGFDGARLGTISALLPLCAAVVPFAAGVMADRLGRRRAIVVLSTSLALAAFSFMLLARDFATVALVVMAYAALRAPALPLVEATAMEVQEGGGPHYGRMRVWGSVAFIGAAVSAGRLVEARGAAVVIPLLIVLLAANAAAALALPADRPRHERAAAAGLGALLRGPALLFLAACVLAQASHGPYYVFYSIHLAKHGYSPSLIGVLWGLAVVAEVFAMLRVAPLLARLGPLPVLALCVLVGSVRWWICATSVAPGAMVVAQVLHAATFGVFHVAAVTHTHRLFGAGRGASGQAIYGSTAYGLGNIAGMTLSGIGYERLGMAGLFTAAAWVALAGAFLMLAAARRGGRACV